MTEYELLQLQESYDESIATYIMNFISILSGYLLANHFLGSRISTAQFIIMTATYTFAMGLTTSATFNALEKYHLAERALNELDRTWASTVEGASYLVWPLMIALVITYFGSLYFSLASRRHHARET